MHLQRPARWRRHLLRFRWVSEQHRHPQPLVLGDCLMVGTLKVRVGSNWVPIGTARGDGALGIVAMGSTSKTAGTALPAGVDTPITNPLSVLLAVGRRYRIRTSVRALYISSGGPVATCLRFKSASGFLPAHDNWRVVSGMYDEMTCEV